jgi:hypothetical protein
MASLWVVIEKAYSRESRGTLKGLVSQCDIFVGSMYEYDLSLKRFFGIMSPRSEIFVGFLRAGDALQYLA